MAKYVLKTKSFNVVILAKVTLYFLKFIKHAKELKN